MKDEINIGSGMLYSAFPIPAFKVLAKKEEWVAQRVLVGLVSFMGKNNRCVYPSYSTLQETLGMGRSSISSGLTTLKEYGFINIAQFKEGVRWRSKYYLQDACWDSSRMQKEVRVHTKKNGRCRACGELVDRGEYGIDDVGNILKKLMKNV